MPTLNWIGKDKVVNHHAQVPFRVLDHQYGYDSNNPELKDPTKSGNKIIHGENLEALKALLPEFEGKIDCEYIDPPYNTGNEAWVYNDNVNDPHIKKWLGEVVGREGEDMSRHDKWLCMMYPRLRLLYKLLSPQGALFISIDDNEEAYLRMICDEIFGSTCFVANISWQRTYSKRNDKLGVMTEVEHILVYSKNPGWLPNRLPRTASMNQNYANPDNDSRPWASVIATAPSASTHQGMVYAIQHPFTGEMIYPPVGRCWTFEQSEMFRIMSQWADYKYAILDDKHQRASVCKVDIESIRNDVNAIILAESEESARIKAEKIQANGPWPILYFTKNGKGGIRRKTYLDKVEGTPPTNYFPWSDVGHTDEATKELMAIFGGKSPFDTPKPTRLIERILTIATNKNSIVLDSFAGSGTTAHAVLKKNAEDGGNRNFILVELGDYAENITAERIRRVMHGYGEGKNAVEGLGGKYDFYELGKPLFLEDGRLNNEVDIEKIRAYIYYSETRQPISQGIDINHQYWMGNHDETGYYLYYKPDGTTNLSFRTLNKVITQPAESYIVYADTCSLSKEFMATHHIYFKRIPIDIKRF
jgi:adenine-specific DNA-methyltransferase